MIRWDKEFFEGAMKNLHREEYGTGATIAGTCGSDRLE
jgi:hypothetical protein